jgi:hypothetical protein
MSKLSSLLKAVDQIRELDDAKMQLLKDQWAHEREAERLREMVAEHHDTIDLAKSQIWNNVCDLQLNRRESAPSSTDEFCDAVADWVERANKIRRLNAVVRLDGKDLDVPDVDIQDEVPEPRPCYPCKIHREVLAILGEIRPEYREVLRIKYFIRDDERYSDAPGFLPYQWYVAQQMNVSSSTVSRLIKKAVRALRHPYRSERLLAVINEKEVADIHCPAEYLIADIFGLLNK